MCLKFEPRELIPPRRIFISQPAEGNTRSSTLVCYGPTRAALPAALEAAPGRFFLAATRAALWAFEAAERQLRLLRRGNSSSSDAALGCVANGGGADDGEGAGEVDAHAEEGLARGRSVTRSTRASSLDQPSSLSGSAPSRSDRVRQAKPSTKPCRGHGARPQVKRPRLEEEVEEDGGHVPPTREDAPSARDALVVLRRQRERGDGALAARHRQGNTADVRHLHRRAKRKSSKKGANGKHWSRDAVTSVLLE